jgi:hypothetical protein
MMQMDGETQADRKASGHSAASILQICDIDPAGAAAGVPVDRWVDVPAIVDSGAEMSVISYAVASRLLHLFPDSLSFSSERKVRADTAGSSVQPVGILHGMVAFPGPNGGPAHPKLFEAMVFPPGSRASKFSVLVGLPDMQIHSISICCNPSGVSLRQFMQPAPHLQAIAIPTSLFEVSVFRIDIASSAQPAFAAYAIESMKSIKDSRPRRNREALVVDHEPLELKGRTKELIAVAAETTVLQPGQVSTIPLRCPMLPPPPVAPYSEAGRTSFTVTPKTFRPVSLSEPTFHKGDGPLQATSKDALLHPYIGPLVSPAMISTSNSGDTFLVRMSHGYSFPITIDRLTPLAVLESVQGGTVTFTANEEQQAWSPIPSTHSK